MILFFSAEHAHICPYTHLGGGGVGGGQGVWTTDMEDTFKVEAEPYQRELHFLFTPLSVDCHRWDFFLNDRKETNNTRRHKQKERTSSYNTKRYDYIYISRKK